VHSSWLAVLGLGFLLPFSMAAADLEVEGKSSDSGSNPIQRLSQARESSEAPTWIDAGDVPTGYLPAKYEVKADIRFFEGGGVFPKAYLGIFPWLTVGGGVAVRNVIGAGDIGVGDDSAKALFKLRVLEENDAVPALALGWDGPAYSFGRIRGLYLTASKELRTSLGYWQIHGGLNSWTSFKQVNMKDESSAYAAVTSLFANLFLFCEYDDALRNDGGYINAGFRFHFAPINLGVEFRDLGARHGQVARILRVGYTGLF
jgi:hypothetical protein